MGSVKGIHHVALKCAGYDEYQRVLRFYRDILGLPVFREWGEGDGSAAMLGCEAGRIELFAAGGGAASQGAIRHFAFDVADADECCRRVQAAGYTVFDGPRDIVIPSDPPYPARIAFCRGPLGEEIEFFQAK